MPITSLIASYCQEKAVPVSSIPSVQDCVLPFSGSFYSSCTTGLDIAFYSQVCSIYPPGSLGHLAVIIPGLIICPGIQLMHVVMSHKAPSHPSS